MSAKFEIIYGMLITGILSPGPSFLFIVLNSLRYNKLNSLLIATGMSCCNVCIASGILFILKKIVALDSLWMEPLQLIGALYFLAISLLGLRKHLKLSSLSLTQVKASTALSITRAFFYGFIFQFFNPKVWIFFLSSCSAATLSSNNITIFHIIIFIAITSFIWYVIVAFLVKKVFLYRIFKYFILATSMMMLVLSLVFVINFTLST